MGAEISHPRGFRSGEIRPAGQDNHRNGTTGRTVLTDEVMAAATALRNVLADKVRSAKKWREAMNQFAVLYNDRSTGITQ